MAKLRGPLFSLSARNQIGKVLVFFTWKGLDVVRKYVVPANPNTALQQTQRGYFQDGVNDWHLTKYTAVDKTAWNRYAGIFANPLSGFNAFVRSWILTAVVPLPPEPPFGASLTTGGAGVFDAYMQEDGSAVSARLRWGYSKTNMPYTQALAEAPANTWTAAGIAATVGSYIYGYYEVLNVGLAVLGRTGLYTLLIV